MNVEQKKRQEWIDYLRIKYKELKVDFYSLHNGINHAQEKIKFIQIQMKAIDDELKANNAVEF